MRSMWELRTAEFHALRVLTEAGKPVVAMALDPRCADELLDSWLQLRALWLKLPSHPLDRFIAIAGERSDLRVRAAQLARSVSRTTT